MVKEVKKMSLKLEFAGEGRLPFSFDSRLWAMFIRRAYCKKYAGSRYIFTIAHNLMHMLMTELWHWIINDKPLISDLLVWFDPYAADMSRSGARMRAVVFSELLHVRFLQLAERIKASVDVFCKALPRHQDRGSGDAVTDNDNLAKKERKPYIAAVAADCATFIYKIIIGYEEVFKCWKTKSWIITTI